MYPCRVDAKTPFINFNLETSFQMKSKMYKYLGKVLDVKISSGEIHKNPTSH